MSESRTVDKLTLAPTTTIAEAEGWLRRYGVRRVAVIDDPQTGLAAVLWQEACHEAPSMAVVGDVLAAVDLGGTSGEPTVINHGPEAWPS